MIGKVWGVKTQDGGLTFIIVEYDASRPSQTMRAAGYNVKELASMMIFEELGT